MAFIFPDPTQTPEFKAANGITYAWDDVSLNWEIKNFGVGQSAVIVSDDPPQNVADGTVWYSTTSGILHVQITDIDSTQWVATNIPVASPDITALEARITDLENKNTNSIRIAPQPPTSDLVQGNVWIDENSYNAYVWTGTEWIQLTTTIA